MTIRLAPLRQLLKMPHAELRAAYGPKVAENVWLMRQQPHCPVKYQTVPGVGIPAKNSGYRLNVDHLRKAMFSLVGRGPVVRVRDPRFYRVPLLVRSSDTVNEGSGRQDSPVVIFDRLDPATSFVRLLRTVTAMQEQRSMGILLQRMLGGPVRLTDDRIVWGYNLQSGVGETHNPYVPNESLVSLVSGLATTIVDPTRGAPLNVTADALTGKITQVSNRAPHLYLQENQDIVPVLFADQYAQSVRAFLDLGTGAVSEAAMEDRHLEAMKRYVLRDGVLTSRSNTSMRVLTHVGVRRTSMQDVGKLPISSPNRLRDWFGVLRHFRNAEQPMQFEGAFLPGRATRLHLFQGLQVPAPQGDVKITISDPHITGDMTLGFADVHCPLLIFLNHGAHVTAEESRWMREFDVRQQAAGKPYAVFAQGHVGEIVKATPNASIRLDQHALGGVTTHAVTDIRLRMGGRSGLPMFFSAGVEYDVARIREVGRSISLFLTVIDHAHLQANNRRFVGELLP